MTPSNKKSVSEINKEYEEIFDFLRKNNRIPHPKKSELERVLCNRILYYRTEHYNAKEFSSKLRVLKKELGIKTRVISSPKELKKQIIDWIKRNGRIPSANGKLRLKSEKRIAKRLSNYVSPASTGFDLEFRKLLEEKHGMKPYRPGKKPNVRERFKEVVSFMQENNRMPSVSNPEEIKLLHQYRRFTLPSSRYTTTRRINVLKHLDKCYKTGIKCSLRPIINEALKASIPLVDMLEMESK